MAGSWGPAKNRIRIGIFYDAISVSNDGKTAKITNARIRIDRGVNISDTSNNLSWSSSSGGAVAGGSDANINVSGSGAKTIKNLSESTVTLSSTKNVTATISARFTGINYAGGDLTCSVTIKFPKRFVDENTDPEAPPVNPGGDAFPDPWEDPDSPDPHLEPIIESTYRVTIKNVEVPAWNVIVDLDGGRTPYGVAEFSVPLDRFTEANFADTSPFLLPVVQVTAGWKYGGTLNEHLLFSGCIVDRTLSIDGETAEVRLSCESFETILNYPSHLALAVNNAWTTVGEFFAGGAFYREPKFVEHPANVAPDANALAEYRALAIEINDDLGDFARSCASTLNQWMRGSMTTATPTIEMVSDPYPYARLWTLPLDAFSRLERADGLSEWGNIVLLETVWTVSADGDTKSKRQTYTAASVTSGVGAVRGQSVTLNQKPPGSTTPSKSWYVGRRWLRRVDESQRGWYTADARAIWGLTPRIDGIWVPDAPIEDSAGTVTRVQFDVDRGLMGVTWATAHP